MEKKTKPKDVSDDDAKKDNPKDRQEKLAEEGDERSYYYDDAHGYEVFNSENDDEDDD